MTNVPKEPNLLQQDCGEKEKPMIRRSAVGSTIGCFVVSSILAASETAGPKPALYQASVCSSRQISKTFVLPSPMAMVPAVSWISDIERLGLPQLLMNGPLASTQFGLPLSA